MPSWGHDVICGSEICIIGNSNLILPNSWRESSWYMYAGLVRSQKVSEALQCEKSLGFEIEVREGKKRFIIQQKYVT